MQRILVWDLPVRVFHWTLVALVAAAWITVEAGWMTIHSYIGYTVLGLVLFRVLWGLVGSDTARFTQFLRAPAEAWQFVRNLLGGSSPHYDGHNPAGGWMVVALLLVLLVQAGTGLFSSDDVLFTGPLVRLVGSDWSEWITEVHEANFNLIIALVVVHVAAVAWHEFSGERLVRPMLDGYKDSDGAAARVRPLWLAILMLAVAAAAVWWILSLAPAPVSSF